MKRLDRSQYTLKDALDEIALAEAILDGIGADEGLTLWGRIASVKAAEPSVHPTLLTLCQYCNREHDSRVACPEYSAKSQSG